MNFGLLIPELILVGIAIVVILLDLVVQRKVCLAVVSIAGLVVSAGFAIAMWGGGAQAIFNNMLAVDNFAIFFKLLFLAIAVLVILASTDYVSKFARFKGEYYALVLLSTLGMMLMAATAELISIYIALELTSISLYILVGFLKDSKSINIYALTWRLVQYGSIPDFCKVSNSTPPSTSHSLAQLACTIF